MKTGEVATAAGVNIETLRYYEKRGLIRSPKRRDSGYRAYAPETVEVVLFIKRAQSLGFTLGEIEELLSLRNNDARTCREVKIAAQGKILEIETKVASLTNMKQALSKLVETCTDDASTRECPILEALDNKGQTS